MPGQRRLHLADLNSFRPGGWHSRRLYETETEAAPEAERAYREMCDGLSFISYTRPTSIRWR
jgi:hypothetical protein